MSEYLETQWNECDLTAHYNYNYFFLLNIAIASL